MRHAVILSGGGGTRLWPASRRSRPKQLLHLGTQAGETLLGATLRRLTPILVPERTWIVTSADLAEATRAAAPAVPADQIVAEPVPRNTAAAVGLAAALLARRDPAAVMAVSPADHHVTDERAFRRVVDDALTAAESAEAIVTIGIRPTRPDTGFGYLEADATVTGATPVVRFVEKPDLQTAQRYLASGRYLWNSGMFFFPATRVLAELLRHLPAVHAGVEEIAAAWARGPAEMARVAARIYPGLPSVSIDTGVMEKAAGILTIPADVGWSDVGSFAALAETRPADADGNVALGMLLAVDSRRNVVVADDGTMVALLGVEDLVVVRSGNAVLVMPRERAQDVREIVRRLEERRLTPYL